MGKWIIVLSTVLLFSACQNTERETNTNTTQIQENKETALPPPETNIVLEQMDTCREKVKIERRRISGNSMSPLLQNNDKVFLLHDYYKICNEKPKKGDLIAYDFVGEKIPIIKKLVATSEDFLQIKNGALWINGTEYKNSGNQKYHFTKGEIRMLEIYMKGNRLQKDTYFILGDNTGNSRDSRKFGAIHPDKILGKFELIPKE